MGVIVGRLAFVVVTQGMRVTVLPFLNHLQVADCEGCERKLRLHSSHGLLECVRAGRDDSDVELGEQLVADWVFGIQLVIFLDCFPQGLDVLGAGNAQILEETKGGGRIGRNERELLERVFQVGAAKIYRSRAKGIDDCLEE